MIEQEALMIFKYLHIAPANNVGEMVEFSEKLLNLIHLKSK
jgi:hypothetical protein